MPNCEQLIIDIQETIRENGNNEITGPILQDVLIDMVHALCGEQQSFDELTMWSLLSKATPEQINVSHLSATDVAGMLTQAGYKLTDTTYTLATDAVAGLLKTGYAASGRNYAVELDEDGRAFVNVPWTDKFDTYFGVDEDGNIYVKDNRGFWSNSFISARGSDPEAGSGGGGSGVDMESVWYALAQPTSEKINVSHLSANNVAQLLTAAGYKLTDTTYGLATDTVSGLIKTGYAENGKNYAVKLDDTGAAYVTVNWQDKFDTYFGVDGDGNIYVKDNRGFYGNSFVSARGSDPEAGSGGGGGGLDVQAMWYALGQPTNEKINVSHIPSIGMDKVSGLADALAAYALKDGSNASGAWPISISGIANRAVYLTSTYTGSGGLQPPSYFNGMGLKVNMMNQPSSYCDVIVVNGYGGQGSDVPYINALAFKKSSAAHGDVWHARGDYGGSSWGTWYKLLDEYNYADYLDTRYLQKSGNASSATKLATARLLWGRSFDGTGNVSGDMTGVGSITMTGVLSLTGAASGIGLLVDNSFRNLSWTVDTSGGWARALKATDPTGSTTLINAIGVYGEGQTPEYVYLGGTSFSSPSMAITAAGNVGIGTTSPGYRLDVRGTGYFSGVLTASAGLTTPQYVQVGNARLKWDASANALYVEKSDGTACGFYSKGFISARGSDPEAGSGGGSGVDMESVWYALGQPTSEKINVSHIPALQQLSGTLTNAQLANSSITVADVKVPLGSAVTTAQIASALTAAGYKLTDTTYTLSSFGITASASELNKLDGLATTAKELGYVHGVTSNIQTQLNSKASASALSGYLPLAGGAMTGVLTISTSGCPLYIQGGSSTESYLKVRLGGTDKSAFGYSVSLGTYLYSYTYGGYLSLTDSGLARIYKGSSLVGTLWHSGNDGSGSGLDADLLDGTHKSGLLTALTSNTTTNLSLTVGGTVKTVAALYATYLGGQTLGETRRGMTFLTSSFSAAGWYRVYTSSSGNLSSESEVLLHIGRNYYSPQNEHYSFSICVGYNGDISITQLSGVMGGHLITKIRVVWDNSQKFYIDIYSAVSSYNNTYGVTGQGYGTFSAFTSGASIPDGYTAYEFTTVDGCKSDRGFSGTLSGNASSATKLATARNLWGRSFDGTGNVSGDMTGVGSITMTGVLSLTGAASGIGLLVDNSFRNLSWTVDTSRGWARALKATDPTGSTTLINAVGVYGEGQTPEYVYLGGTSFSSPSMAITAAGNVGIGTTSPGYRLDVIGTIHSTTGIWSNGYVSAKGQDTTSDARYKRDVAALPAQAALSVLMRLRPATWAWKDDGRRGAGFVAQEVLGVLPEAVREVGDGEDRHLALNYQMLHAYEVCLLQTHETELERLRSRVNQLENEIKEYKDKCNA